MKTILFLFFVISSQMIYSQKPDTVYLFFPKISKNVGSVRRLDSIQAQKKVVYFNIDKNEPSRLHVSIKSEKGKLLEEGIYLLDTARIVYNRVVEPDGNSHKEIRYVEAKFLRQGDWQILRRNKKKLVKYEKGKKVR